VVKKKKALSHKPGKKGGRPMDKRLCSRAQKKSRIGGAAEAGGWEGNKWAKASPGGEAPTPGHGFVGPSGGKQLVIRERNKGPENQKKKKTCCRKTVERTKHRGGSQIRQPVPTGGPVMKCPRPKPG